MVALVLLVPAGCSKQQDRKPQPPPVRVDVAKVEFVGLVPESSSVLMRSDSLSWIKGPLLSLDVMQRKRHSIPSLVPRAARLESIAVPFEGG